VNSAKVVEEETLEMIKQLQDFDKRLLRRFMQVRMRVACREVRRMTAGSVVVEFSVHVLIHNCDQVAASQLRWRRLYWIREYFRTRSSV
jgi:hypothetical protein